MIIVKMNDSSVECSIAASELKEIGLTPEALMNGEKNGIVFLDQMNQEIREQLGYNPDREVLLMSRNMAPDGSFHIYAIKMTNEDIQAAGERIREAAYSMLEKVAQDKLNAITSLSGKAKGEALGKLFSEISEDVNRVYTREQHDKSQPVVLTKPAAKYASYLIEVESLQAGIRLARVLQSYPITDSALYRDAECFYLQVGLKMEEERVVYDFRKTCLEYADNILVNSPDLLHLEEAGKKLIEKDAIRHLADMQG